MTPNEQTQAGSELKEPLGPCGCMDPEGDLECGDCGRITKPAKIEQERDRYRLALEKIAADGVDHLACQCARDALKDA